MNAEQQAAAAEAEKAKGNDAFKRGDYRAAVDRYSAALQILAQDGEQAPAPLSSALRQTLLTNRSLALYRLGDYAVAAGDAEAALQLDATSAKAAFRATAARLMLGDGEAATRHALLLKSLASCPGGDDAASAAWAVAARHAAALEERQRRLAAHSQRPDCPAQQEAERLLAALAAEAEGEGDAELAPAALLQQLGTLLSGSIDGGGGSSKYSHSSVSLTVAEAAAGACAALERDPQGYGLLLFFLADPDPQCRQAAAAALLSAGQMGPAAGGGAGAESDGGEAAAVLWPAQVWRRLVGMAADCASSSAAVAALRLLGSAAQRDAWVRQQLLVHPLPGAEPGAPGDAPAAPVARVAAMLHDDGTLCRLSPAAVEAAAELLRLYASDAAAAAGLLHLGSRPLLALVRAAVAAEGMPAFQPSADDDSAGGAASAPAAVGSKESLEQEALQQLRKKRQAVYNAELAALQRRLLGAAAQLAGASRDLVAAEAVQAAGAGKKGVKAGPLLTELLALVRNLHERQPRRTAPVLGPDGAPKAYAKRRYAADYKDNPAGDFLVSLELPDSPPGSGANSGTNPVASSAAPGGPTLLELALALLQHVAGASAGAAALLYRRDLFGLCEELAGYVTPSVVDAAQRLYATVADRVPSAAEELLQGRSPHQLAALLLHSGSPQRQLQALDGLAAVADTCSGDDFALLTGTAPGAAEASSAGTQCAAYSAWALAKPDGEPAPEGGMRAAARRFLQRCCERAQRQQQLGGSTPPRGGAWAAIGRQGLQQLLQPAQQGRLEGASSVQGAQQEEAAFTHLRRGFLGKPAASKPAAASSERAAAAATPACQAQGAAVPAAALPGHCPSVAASATYKSGAVVIEEIDAAQPSAQQQQQQQQQWEGQAAALAAPGAEQGGSRLAGSDDDDDVSDLRDVFDSGSAVAAEQRRLRAEWMALPLDKKVRWTQTSLDVSAHALVPAGTRASEVQVTTTAGRLAVSLGWYGRVLDGPLHRRVKPSETHWCLEDSEVHVLLAKAEHGAWWKALFEGGQERSYHELLREAVDAEEPVQPYDELDDSAKGLIEAIQERQAYIQAGLIDPEGFDDFRVVLGEGSLGPPK